MYNLDASHFMPTHKMLAIYFQVTSINREEVRTALSQHQKFRKVLTIAQELSSLASEVGMAEFEERLDVLKQLRDAWANGRRLQCKLLKLMIEVWYAYTTFVLPDVTRIDFTREWMHFW